MASSLSQERQEDIGLAKQEDLHDQIIDDGLGRLYETFLETAEKRCRTHGIQSDTSLLKGKAYHALTGFIEENGVGLAVVGRHGHHQYTGSHDRLQYRSIGAHSPLQCPYNTPHCPNQPKIM